MQSFFTDSCYLFVFNLVFSAVFSESPKPESTALELAPVEHALELAQLELKKDESLTEAPPEEAAFAPGQVPALEFALAFRREAGINQQLSPGEFEGSLFEFGTTMAPDFR